MFVRTAVLALIAAAGADAFVAPTLPTAPSTRRAGVISNVKMGFFDNIMGNQKPVEKFDPVADEIVTGLQPVKGQVLITFLPSGAQVNARPGEKMGDAARRAGLNVPYGCKQGVCGTCEATQRQPNGQVVQIRVCSVTVPKTNLDAPDREKMWGDLRGGKKSVNELRATPDSLEVVMQNPNIALKRKATYEQSKDAIAANTKDWLSPDYKSPQRPPPPPGGNRPPPPAAPQKKGWPFG